MASIAGVEVDESACPACHLRIIAYCVVSSCYSLTPLQLLSKATHRIALIRHSTRSTPQTHINQHFRIKQKFKCHINPLSPELNPIYCLLALLGAHNFLHVSRIRVKLLTFRRLMSYIYEAPILDVSRSHTTTQHSR